MKRRMRNRIFSAMEFLLVRMDFFFSTLRSYWSIRFQYCSAGKGLRTSGPCYFKARKAGSIRLGEEVYLIASHRTNRVGLSNPVILETLGDGEIEIGDRSGASSVIISSRSRVAIGSNVILGGNVRVFDHDFHAFDPQVWRTSSDEQLVKTKPIVIGDNVFVGTNATILKGVTIGNDAIIAAGAVVTKDVGRGEIWGGNPAVFIRKKIPIDETEGSVVT